MRPKLYRSRNDRVLSGLSGGLAQHFQINPTLLRILLILSIPITSGTTILIYLIACAVVPKEPPVYHPFDFGTQDNYQEDRYGGPRNTYGGYWGTSQNAYEPDMYNTPHKSNSHNFGKNRPPHEQPEPVNKATADLDSMMVDIEKKALRKEVEELRKKIAQYEKGEQ